MQVKLTIFNQYVYCEQYKSNFGMLTESRTFFSDNLHINTAKNKQLSYCRGTARHLKSVEILSAAAQLYKKSHLTRRIALSRGIKISPVGSFDQSQSTRVTDGRTDRKNYDFKDHTSIAASRGKNHNMTVYTSRVLFAHSVVIQYSALSAWTGRLSTGVDEVKQRRTRLVEGWVNRPWAAALCALRSQQTEPRNGDRRGNHRTGSLR